MSDTIKYFSKTKTKEVVAAFKTEIHDKQEIDPDNEYDWYALTLGWALGKGYTVSQAHDIARFIRYSTNLG